MKITTQKAPALFTPVAVTFLCETKAELDTLSSLFNCAPVIDVLDGFSNKAFTNAYTPFYDTKADTGLTTDIAKGLANHPLIKQKMVASA